MRAIVNDGDNLVIFAKVPPNTTDPMGQYPAMAGIYRVVVASAFFKLVPLGDPVRVSDIDFAQLEKSLQEKKQ